MSIRGISFGNLFSGRKLRFDSQKSNFDISFEHKKGAPHEVGRIKYGHPDIKAKKHVPPPPMLKYAPPPEPKNNTGFSIKYDKYTKGGRHRKKPYHY